MFANVDTDVDPELIDGEDEIVIQGTGLDNIVKSASGYYHKDDSVEIFEPVEVVMENQPKLRN